jgi:3-deoxy-7-phosphoheptulonate synthase / chorismate mutase
MTKKILALRKKIDQIDQKIINSLNKRLAISSKIGKIKKINNVNIKDPTREKNLLKNLISHNKKQQGNLRAKEIKEFYKAIFKMSQAQQK